MSRISFVVLLSLVALAPLAAAAVLPEAEEQPGVYAVDVLDGLLCGETSAQQNSTQCRAIAGRPVMPGALDLCVRSSSHSVLYRAVNEAFSAANAALEDTTTALFPGTPLEGESFCHDHRQTLRALATLP